ncbi:uncharacterized protein B0H18DRAFT_894583, partial [Fomitopsis serialis]|uniref:uncharacterized protein n=1 Tax=Fomitopsis serialis TaxID=139415 RepID=UPI00200796B4
ILGVTCDNATSNDVMIEEMEKMIMGFPGRRARSRCFCHIVNLVAKSLLRQFEPPKPRKKKKNEDGTDEYDESADDDPELSDYDRELQELMEDLDFDETEEIEDGQGDDIDGLWDAREDLSTEKRSSLEEEVRPVKMMLVKVSINHIHRRRNLPWVWLGSCARSLSPSTARRRSCCRVGC